MASIVKRDQIKGRLQLSAAERQTLAELGKKLGKQTQEKVAKAAKPDTILGWHRKALIIINALSLPPIWGASPGATGILSPHLTYS